MIIHTLPFKISSGLNQAPNESLLAPSAGASPSSHPQTGILWRLLIMATIPSGLMNFPCPLTAPLCSHITLHPSSISLQQGSLKSRSPEGSGIARVIFASADAKSCSADCWKTFPSPSQSMQKFCNSSKSLDNPPVLEAKPSPTQRTKKCRTSASLISFSFPLFLGSSRQGTDF